MGQVVVHTPQHPLWRDWVEANLATSRRVDPIAESLALAHLRFVDGMLMATWREHGPAAATTMTHPLRRDT